MLAAICNDIIMDVEEDPWNPKTTHSHIHQLNDAQLRIFIEQLEESLKDAFTQDQQFQRMLAMMPEKPPLLIQANQKLLEVAKKEKVIRDEQKELERLEDERINGPRRAREARKRKAEAEKIIVWETMKQRMRKKAEAEVYGVEAEKYRVESNAYRPRLLAAWRHARYCWYASVVCGGLVYLNIRYLFGTMGFVFGSLFGIASLALMVIGFRSSRSVHRYETDEEKLEEEVEQRTDDLLTKFDVAERLREEQWAYEKKRLKQEQIIQKERTRHLKVEAERIRKHNLQRKMGKKEPDNQSINDQRSEDEDLIEEDLESMPMEHLFDDEQPDKHYVPSTVTPSTVASEKKASKNSTSPRKKKKKGTVVPTERPDKDEKLEGKQESTPQDDGNSSWDIEELDL